MKQIIPLALMLVLSASCNQQEPDTKAEADKLMQTSRQWSQVAQSKNVDSILSYWTDDAVVISAGEPTLRGKSDIRQMVEGSFKDSAFRISWEPESAEVAESGDIGYLLESTKMNMVDSLGKPATQTFKVVTIWKKQADGHWKCAVDVLSPLAQSVAQINKE